MKPVIQHITIAIISMSLLSVGLTACAGPSPSTGASHATSPATASSTTTASKHTQSDLPDATDDQLHSEQRDNMTFFVFQFDGRTYPTSGFDTVSLPTETLRDGSFYQVVADVTLLNGGVAGYVDYPQIKQLHSCVEISPDSLQLPSIDEKRYGLMRIGDYADGDLLFNESGIKAVWKGGTWVYRYDKTFEPGNGTLVFYRDGTAESAITERISQGILSCADYFVMPPLKSS